MSNLQTNGTGNIREHERVEIDDEISIRFDTAPISGSGQNISEQGVFFIAEGSIAVQVQLEGRTEAVAGRIVRVENMGAGMVGIAVKFDEPHRDLID